jgi:hypothetical protein
LSLLGQQSFPTVFEDWTPLVLEFFLKPDFYLLSD